MFTRTHTPSRFTRRFGFINISIALLAGLAACGGKASSGSSATAVPIQPTPTPVPRVENLRIQGHTTSRVQIDKGDYVWIQAGGEIKEGPFVGFISPDGRDNPMLNSMYNIDSGLPFGSLICRWSDQREWSLCGSETVFQSKRSGTIEFEVNDRDKGAHDPRTYFSVRVVAAPYEVRHQRNNAAASDNNHSSQQQQSSNDSSTGSSGHGTDNNTYGANNNTYQDPTPEPYYTQGDAKPTVDPYQDTAECKSMGTGDSVCRQDCKAASVYDSNCNDFNARSKSDDEYARKQQEDEQYRQQQQQELERQRQAEEQRHQDEERQRQQDEQNRQQQQNTYDNP